MRTAEQLDHRTHGFIVRPRYLQECSLPVGNKIAKAGEGVAATQWILDKLEPVLHEQDGFVTSAQARHIGIDGAKLDRLLAAGVMRRVRRGVYVLERLAPIPRVSERIYAAWLAMDGKRLPWERHEPLVVISHATAAGVHQLGTIVDDDEIHFSTTDRSRRTSYQDIAVHRVDLDIDDWRWERDHRIVVTTPARTVVDLAVEIHERDYLIKAAWAVVQETRDGSARLRAALDRHPKRASTDLRWLRIWLEEQP